MLRITGGRLRGRRIPAPKGKNTRPTLEKPRAGIFDTLSQWIDLEGAEIWDCFAGSGALGIEALSRGAERAIFLESHAPSAAALRATLRALSLPESQWSVFTTRAETWLRDRACDPALRLILLDPPYASPLAGAVLEQLGGLASLPHEAVIVLETDRRNRPDIPASLELLKSKSYGDTELIYLNRCR